MQIVLLDAETLGDDISLEAFKNYGNLTVYEMSRPEEIPERIRRAQVVMTNKCRITREALEQAENLQLVLEAATGYDNIDIDCCRERGIAVCNVKGYSTDSVATLTAAMVLGLLCRIADYDAFCRSGDYTRSGRFNLLTPPFYEAAGKTWGIIGAGHIGAKVGEVAKALGCEVIVYQRHPSDMFPTVSLQELCRRADIISLHVPLNEESRGLIGEEELALMKPGCILINVARGPVVDEAAVADALLKDRLGAFGCDVYSTEPFPAEHPYQAIKELPNVILTPHMAWGSVEARIRLLKEMEENLQAFLRGEKRNRVD